MTSSVTGSEPANAAGAPAVHEELRELILDGRLEPGSVVSQVKLATQLGVSRTPLREALRMLQQEGLIHSETNRRVRVASTDLNDLEHVYSHRILLEALGITLTVPLFTNHDLDALRTTLREMDEATQAEDDERWDALHRHFHRQLVMHAPTVLVEGITRWQSRARRYRRGYSSLFAGSPRARAVGQHEHQLIVEACAMPRQPRSAAALLARHLARTALTLATEMHPEHDPTTLRGALQVVVHDDRSDTSELTHLPAVPVNVPVSRQ